MIVFSITRFAIVLHANVTKSYQNVTFIFLLMALLPFLFMTKTGRKTIGLRRPVSFSNVLIAVGIGTFFGGVIFYILLWFGASHPYSYIAESYKIDPEQLADQRLIFFLIYSIISISFSPIGEEFFYRGVIHQNFKVDIGDRHAAIVDSAAFALVHLSHFGINYINGGWQFDVISSILWVLLLFFTCLGFNYSRKVTKSIWGAVLAHASFNITMNFFIFYFIY